MKIKICGLKRTEDVQYVNAAKPDYAGFVFAGAKRKIDFDTAKALKRELDSQILSVGVFVNEDVNFIARLAVEGVIDVIQLHGDEDAEYLTSLKKVLADNGISQNCNKKITIIKAIRVKNREQVEQAQTLDVDYLLLDAFREEEYGGSGKVFDHQLIPPLSKPYFLAGGISADNVTEILASLRDRDMLPYCIDVSSSVETDGVKDEAKIRELVELVRAWEN